MARTMVANIPGARLRAVEQELTEARGEEAVNAVIEAHPEESKVLQQLVEWRRAGRQVPPLSRVQRVMLWSDSSMELSAAPMGEAPSRGPGRGPGAPGGSGGFGNRPGGARGGDRRGGPRGAGGSAGAGAFGGFGAAGSHDRGRPPTSGAAPR